MATLKARPEWKFNASKPEAERTIQADQLREALLANAGDLEIENAIVTGTLRSRGLHEFKHFLGIAHTRFLGDVDLNDVVFQRSVHLKQCEFKTNLDLSCTEIHGDLNLDDSTVVGLLDVEDATIHDHIYLTGIQVGHDLNLQRSNVKRNIFCSPSGTRRPAVGGHANLAAVKVAGQTILSGLHVKKDLNMQQAELEGGLFCRPWDEQAASGKPRGTPTPTHVEGSVLMLAAKVRDLLDLSDARIGGHLNVSRVTVHGQGDFSGIALGGHFDLQGTKFDNDVRIALRDAAPAGKPPRPRSDEGLVANLQDCVIAHVLYNASACPTRLVKLNFAQIDVLEFPDVAPAKKKLLGRQRLSSLPERTRLEGLRFRDFEFPPHCDESIEAMNWLKSDPSVPEGMTRQIEKWFRNKGSHDKANVFYLELQRRQRRTRPIYIQILEKLVIDLGTSYGLRTSRLLVLFVILLALSFMLFQHSDSTVLREDRLSLARLQTEPPAGGFRVPDWDWVDGLWMAVHLNLPMIELPVTADWRPSHETARFLDYPLEGTVPGLEWRLALTYRDYGSLVTLLGWIMVPLYFAGTIHYWFQQRNPQE